MYVSKAGACLSEAYSDRLQPGATTPSITILSIKEVFVTPSMNHTQHKQSPAFMLRVILLSA